MWQVYTRPTSASDFLKMCSNEHKFDMKKFQTLDVGALILWRAFSLTEISLLFWYEN
jgi:hypothetical protein